MASCTPRDPRSDAPRSRLDGVSPGWIEVVIPSGMKARGVVTHRLRRDDRPGSMWVRGFRATNVERTLLDLFSVLPQRGAELALEDALRRRLTTLNRLWDLYREVGGPGRNGSGGCASQFWYAMTRPWRFLREDGQALRRLARDLALVRGPAARERALRGRGVR
jgi:hypothetical protein